MPRKPILYTRPVLLDKNVCSKCNCLQFIHSTGDTNSWCFGNLTV
jgi:hypothetical protein